MDKSIRVRILGHDYALRVPEEHEAATKQIAAMVGERMQSFRNAHPDQPELTAAIIIALGLADEAQVFRDENERLKADIAREADDIRALLDVALGEEEAGDSSGSAHGLFSNEE